MVVEVRSYRIKPGYRDKFISFFETKTVPAQQALGIKIIGPLLDSENPNKFVWLRFYASHEERELKRNEFYSSDIWKNELEPVAIPLLESYDVIVTETTPGFIADTFL